MSNSFLVEIDFATSRSFSSTHLSMPHIQRPSLPSDLCGVTSSHPSCRGRDPDGLRARRRRFVRSLRPRVRRPAPQGRALRALRAPPGPGGQLVALLRGPCDLVPRRSLPRPSLANDRPLDRLPPGPLPLGSGGRVRPDRLLQIRRARLQPPHAPEDPPSRQPPAVTRKKLQESYRRRLAPRGRDLL